MKASEIEQDPIDVLRYNDYFDYIDNRFMVRVFDKPWKAFPTQELAQAAADNVNKKKKRLVAFVVER